MLRTLISVVVVIALLLHNLPYLIRDQAVIWLLNNGAEKAEFKALNIGWFSGTVQIDGLQAEAEGRPALRLDKLLVDLDYSKLSDKKLLLSAIEVSGVIAGVREEAGSLWLGPIDINALNGVNAEGRSEPQASSEWSFGVAELSLVDVDWRAEVAGQDHRLKLNSGRLADFYLWDQLQAVSIDLDGSLNAAPLLLQSTSKPLPNDKSSELQIKLDNFPLHSITALVLPELKVMVDVDLTINAQSNLQSKESRIRQSGSLRLRDLNYAQEGLKLKQKSLSWSGSVDLALRKNQLHSVKSNNTISMESLQAELAGQSLGLDLDQLKVKGDLSSQGLKQLLLKGLQLDAKNLQVKQGEQILGLSGLKLLGSLKSENMQHWQVSVPQLDLNQVLLAEKEQPLIQLASAHLKNANAQHTDVVDLEALKLHELVVQGDGGVFTRWQDIGVSGLSLSKMQQLDIDLVTLRNSQTRVHLSKKRQLSDLDWLLARIQSEVKNTPAEPLPEKSTRSPAGSPPFNVQIKKVNLSGKNPILIVDEGVKPAFKTIVDLNKLELSQINTASKGKTAFVLQGKNKFSSLNAKGAIELFSGNYGGNWDVEIKGLELPQVSPYSLEYTGYYLHSGQLNLTTKGTIKKRTLAGSSDIRLNKLEVEARNSERSGEFNKKVSMPLDTAIMILQDNDDNIDLDIPIDGSLDDPQFGYQTVINKLAGKGMKNAAMGYLTKALQPFGALISIAQMAMDAKEKGSFITLQPVYFSPADVTLSADSKQYMAKLAQMMKERKAMRMNICGLAVASDQVAIWQQLLEENKKQKKPLAEAALQEMQTQRLLQLAQQRSDVIKGQLSETQGISVERLFSCYPKVDLTSKEKPQVSLGL